VFGLRRYTATATARSVKRERWFLLCHRDMHRPLHLLEGAHLDLAHALARDAELHRQILERDRIVGELARLEDAPLALREHSERFVERFLAVLQLLVLGQPGFLVGFLVDEPILPFAGVAVVADRGIE